MRARILGVEGFRTLDPAQLVTARHPARLAVRSRGWTTCFLFGVLCWLCLLCENARAHDLALDQLLLQPAVVRGELVGQLTFNPHRTPNREGPGARDLSARVVAVVRRDVQLELDGHRCEPKIELRELWEKAGPTVGDILILRCPLRTPLETLRVFAGEGVQSLVVTIEDSRAPAGSRSILISAGTWTPLYLFEKPANDWLPGGAAQFENIAAGSSEEAPAPPANGARSPEAKPQARAPSRIGFGERLGGLAQRYLWLGYRHILPEGWDHVLFVVGLVLGSFRDWRRLLWQMSAFTLAHTLTLALGALGWIVLPKAFVEPVIAFSIAYVAIENLRPSGVTRSRLLLVFVFGLAHGQGFARALYPVGLAKEFFLIALLSFNAGVELGQLSIIALVLALIRALHGAAWLERRALRPASLLIALIGLGWGVQRLFER